MRKINILFFILLIVSVSLYARTSMKGSTIVVKRDYGYIKYAEDFYRLYSLPLYYKEEDLLQNVSFLMSALEAPFDFVNRAITIIETEEEYEKYKDLMQMQFNYLITQNYIYLAGMYDKQNYYFYNAQFSEDIKKSFEYARYWYNMADERFQITKELATRVSKNRAKIGLDKMVDNANKIRHGDIDYSKTARRQLANIENIISKMN